MGLTVLTKNGFVNSYHDPGHHDREYIKVNMAKVVRPLLKNRLGLEGADEDLAARENSPHGVYGKHRTLVIHT